MADQEITEQVEAKNRKGPGLFVKLAIGIAVLALQVTVSFVLAKKLAPPPPDSAAEELAEKPAGDRQKEFGSVYLVEDVIVNPAGSHGKKFLNTTVAFVYLDGKVGSELEKRDVQVRDVLLRVLGSHKTEELGDPAFRDSLRTAVLNAVNQILTTGEVTGVYFSSFVMQ